MTIVQRTFTPTFTAGSSWNYMVRRLARNLPQGMRRVYVSDAITLEAVPQLVVVDATSSFTITLPSEAIAPHIEIVVVVRSITAGEVVTIGGNLPTTLSRMHDRCVVRLVAETGTWGVVEDSRRVLRPVQHVEDAAASVDAATVYLVRTTGGPYAITLPLHQITGNEITLVVPDSGNNFELKPANSASRINYLEANENLPLAGGNIYRAWSTGDQWWVTGSEIVAVAE